jgi:hypothetical protein
MSDYIDTTTTLEVYKCKCGMPIPLFSSRNICVRVKCECGEEFRVAIDSNGKQTAKRIMKPEVPHAGE